jgi:uncharacterized YigZ family protein
VTSGDDTSDDSGPVRPDGGERAEDPDAYRTVAGRGRAEFAVRGSEFVGLVDPARDRAAAEAFVESVRAEHPDATHVVPAYRVRADPLREYASDDGEPTSSAGDPALNVLQQRELENVVAAVVRYYGGTNLGVGGLARSYSRAVADAVEAAGVVTERPQATVRVVVDYDDSGTVRSLLESAGVAFDADYQERVAFEVRVPVADRAGLLDEVRSATSGRAAIESGAEGDEGGDPTHDHDHEPTAD